MPEGSSITSEILDSITGGITTLVLNNLKDKIATSKLASSIKSKFSYQEVDQLTRKICTNSIADSLHEIKQSHKEIKLFLQDSTNKAIISGWILSSNIEEIDKSGLQYNFPVTLVVEKNLERFVTILLENIKKNKDALYPPYVDEILNNLFTLKKGQEDIKHDINQVGFKVERSTEQMFDRFDQVISILNSQSTNSVHSLKNLDEINELIENGQLSEARDIANKRLILSKDDQEICELNRAIANTYLKNYGDQKLSIPFIEEITRICKDDLVVQKNKVLLYTLKEDYEQALIHVDKLIESKNDVESVGLKAHILWQKKDFNTAVTLLEKQDFNHFRHYYNLAYSYYYLGDIELANTYIEKSLNLKDDLLDTLELKISVESLRFKDALAHKQNIYPTEKEVERLKEALVIVEKIIENINPEDVTRLSNAYLNKAVILHWLLEDKNAAIDLQNALSLTPFDTIVLRNLAYIYIGINQYENALECIESIEKLGYKEQNESEILRFKAAIHIQKSDIYAAIEILNSIIDLDDVKENDLDTLSLLADCYDRILDNEYVEKIISILDKGFKNHPVSRLVKANHLSLLGKFNNAIEVIGEVSEKGKNGLLLLLTKADLLFNLNKTSAFEEAANIYFNLSKSGHNSFTLRRYALCLYNCEKFKECLEVCNEVQREERIELYTRLQGEIYFRTRNFTDAVEAFKWLIIKNPTYTEHYIKYAISLHQLNKIDDAKAVLQRLIIDDINSAFDLINLAFAFSTIGLFEIAIDYAEKAIELGYSDVNVNKAYIQFYLTQLNEYEDFPRDKNIRFNEVLNNFENRFDYADRFFEKLEISQGDPEELKSQILDRLGKNEPDISINSLIKNEIIPICAIAQKVGKSIYDTWKMVTLNPSFSVFISSGNIEERENEINIIKESKSFTIEAITLFVLAHLNRLELLLEVFSEIRICQSLFVELNTIKLTKESAKQSGSMILYEFEGSLMVDKMTPEQAKDYLLVLDRVFKFLETNLGGKVVLVGETINRDSDENYGIFEKYLSGFGYSTSEILYEAYLKNYAVFCSDYFLRIIAKNDIGTKSFGLTAFFEECHRRTLITKDEYNDIIIELMSNKYYLINTDIETLMRMTIKNKFELSKEAFAVLDDYKRENYDLGTLKIITANFLIWFWNDCSDNDKRVKWTTAILNSLSYKRNRENIYTFFKKFGSNNFHPLDHVKRTKFLEIVNMWFTSQLIK